MLRHFLKSYNKVKVKTRGCSPDVAMAELMSGVRDVNPRNS